MIMILTIKEEINNGGTFGEKYFDVSFWNKVWDPVNKENDFFLKVIFSNVMELANSVS